MREVDLRDKPLDPLDPLDVFAAKVLRRCRERDDITTMRFGNGTLSPIEIARIAAEVHEIEDRHSAGGQQ